MGSGGDANAPAKKQQVFREFIDVSFHMVKYCGLTRDTIFICLSESNVCEVLKGINSRAFLSHCLMQHIFVSAALCTNKSVDAVRTSIVCDTRYQLCQFYGQAQTYSSRHSLPRNEAPAGSVQETNMTQIALLSLEVNHWIDRLQCSGAGECTLRCASLRTSYTITEPK